MSNAAFMSEAAKRANEIFIQYTALSARFALLSERVVSVNIGVAKLMFNLTVFFITNADR